MDLLGELQDSSVACNGPCTARHTEAGITLHAGDVTPVIMNAMAVEGDSGITEQQSRSASCTRPFSFPHKDAGSELGAAFPVEYYGRRCHPVRERQAANRRNLVVNRTTSKHKMPLRPPSR